MDGAMVTTGQWASDVGGFEEDEIHASRTRLKVARLMSRM
jgi:hypothetical protein